MSIRASSSSLLRASPGARRSFSRTRSASPRRRRCARSSRSRARPASTGTTRGTRATPTASPRSTGNVATEDLVYLLDGEGIGTGVDLDALIRISEWLETLLGRRLEGYVYRAG